MSNLSNKASPSGTVVDWEDWHPLARGDRIGMLLRQAVIVAVIVGFCLFQLVAALDGLNRENASLARYGDLQSTMVDTSSRLVLAMRDAHYALYKAYDFLGEGQAVADISDLLKSAKSKADEAHNSFRTIDQNSRLLSDDLPLIQFIGQRINLFENRVDTAIGQLVSDHRFVLVTLQAADTEFGATANALDTLANRCRAEGLRLSDDARQTADRVRDVLLIGSIFTGLVVIVLVIVSVRFMFQPLEKLVRRSARALATALQDLARLERLASLGNLVAGVAHELNTPIGNSVMLASFLRDRSQATVDHLDKGGALSPDQTRAIVQEMRDSSQLLIESLERSVALINTFKLVGVAQHAGIRREFALATLFDELLAEFREHDARPGCEYQAQVDPGLLVTSYYESLFLCLQQVLRNAVVHSDLANRGQVSIQLTAAVGPDQQIVIKVVDNGPGIRPGLLPRLFEPFNSTLHMAGRPGLGLYIVQVHVDGVLRGKVGVESRLGEGTTVTITIPQIV